MNNFVIGLKKFFSNKNVVTILGVILVLIILYYGYTSSIKKQTKPVSVPVAAKRIEAKTQITSEDVIYVDVPETMVKPGVIRSAAFIVGKYTNINVTIPEGSLFYSDWIAEQSDIPGNWIEQLNYEAGELGYYMDVNIENTLGNNVLPNTYIDIYMKANDENGTPMIGKLLKNVKILVVHDSSGKDVFKSSTSIGSPSKIGFAVNEGLYLLLKKTEYLRNIELIIAPRGSTVPSKDEIVVTSRTLRDYIDAQTITYEEDIIGEEMENPNEEVNPEQPIVE